jgi:hypothetical protein
MSWDLFPIGREFQQDYEGSYRISGFIAGHFNGSTSLVEIIVAMNTCHNCKWLNR